MNEPSTPDLVSPPRWMKIFLALLGIYLVASIAAYVVAGVLGLSILHGVLFGWVPFLAQRLDSFQPDIASASIGLLALVLLMIGVHFVGRWLTSRENVQVRWTIRSTIAATSVVLVLFAGGVSVVGMAHQAIWLSSDARARTADGASPPWPRPPGALNLIVQAHFTAVQTQSRNNLKQMGLALHNVHDSFGSFPPGAMIDEQGHARHGWVMYLNAYSNFWIPTDWKKEPWDGPTNQKYAKGALPDFVNPQLGWHGQFDEHGYAYMHYAANVHGFPNNRGLKIADITDGTSNTLAIGEVAENFQPWASPWNRRDPADGLNDVPWGFGGPPSQKGALFLFFDGSVKLLHRDIDRSLLKSLGMPNDGAPPEKWEHQ